jgi:hypothetical protein
MKTELLVALNTSLRNVVNVQYVWWMQYPAQGQTRSLVITRNQGTDVHYPQQMSLIVGSLCCHGASVVCSWRLNI